MVTKIIVLICAFAGAFALMAAFWPGAFQPMVATWHVPGTNYSPPAAHLVLLGVTLLGMTLKSK